MGNYLNNTHASFDPRNYGFSKLSALARAQDYLEVKADGQAPRVRLRPRAARSAGRSSAAAAPLKAAQKAPARRTRKAAPTTAQAAAPPR
jgi:hypothetical protein